MTVTLPVRDISSNTLSCPFAPPPDFAEARNVDATVRIGKRLFQVPDCTLATPGRGSRLGTDRKGFLLESDGGFTEAARSLERKRSHRRAHNRRTDEYHQQITRILSDLIREIDHQAERRTRFLWLLYGSLMTLAATPYVLTNRLETQAYMLFGVFGIWACLCVFYYTDRSLKARGELIRTKALYYRQLNLSRAALLRNSPFQWRYWVLPIGLEYDHYPVGQKARHPELPSSRHLMPAFFGLLHLLTLLLVCYFTSLVFVGARRAQEFTGFTMTDFLKSSLLCSFLIPVYVHFTGAACLRFHKLLEEAKRIRPEDPNPKFPNVGRQSGRGRAIVLLVLAFTFFPTTLTGILLTFTDWIPDRIHGVSVPAACYVVLLGLALLCLIAKVAYVSGRIRKGAERWRGDFATLSIRGD